MSDQTVERLRRAIANAAIKNNKKCFPRELKLEILAYAKPILANGVRYDTVAQTLGLNSWTLQKWHQKSRKEEKTESLKSFVEVVGVAELRSPDLTVKCPNGFEIGVPSSFDVETFRRLIVAMEVR